MTATNKTMAKIKAIERTNKKRWLKVNCTLDESSGIYLLTRLDENGIKYAYVGQAKHILTRLAQHLVGYQHIDLSLKKHGLFHLIDNRTGWSVKVIPCDESELNAMEQYWIGLMAKDGYQLRNKTSGSQGSEKRAIAEYRPAKGYYDGIKQGRKTLARELGTIVDKYLTVAPKQGKIAERKYAEFCDLLQQGKEDK